MPTLITSAATHQNSAGFDSTAFEAFLAGRNDPDWVIDVRRKAFEIYREKLTAPLNPEEWETMKRHAEYGAKLLESLRGTERIREIIAHHHEYFDGSGYPDGLAGGQIPLGARIVAIADAYDTLTSERTYKKARTPDEAFLELERCGSAQFDPELVRMFVSRLRHRPNPLIEPVPAPEREVLS